MRTLISLMCGVILTVIICPSCGVKFALAPSNKPLPESFSKRALYPAGVTAYDFHDLVGNVLYIKGEDDPIRIGILRPDKYINERLPVTDPQFYYKSRIQRGAEIQGNYLAFAANFKAEQLAEIELIDIARAGIVFNDVSIYQEIFEKAKVWVAQHPKKDSLSMRLWIQSVVLTRSLYNDYTSIKANAKGQTGDVVGVSSGVYRKSEVTNKEVLVAFDAIDIDKFVEYSEVVDTIKINNLPSNPEALESMSNNLKNSAYSGIIKGTIKKSSE